MASNNPLTPEIIIETLKRSSLNTVLIEGKDDLLIYRQIESELDSVDIDFFPCNGRSNLLEVYKVKDTIEAKLLFICDSDLWLFVPKPEYIIDNDLIATEGYSIENELYQDGLDIIESLFSKDELEKKRAVIDNLCRWFAHEVLLVLADNQHNCKFADVSLLNTSIMEVKATNFKDDFLASRNFTEPKAEVLEDITQNYMIKLRGKFLFQTIEKIFQERPKEMVKYRKDQIFDMIYRLVSKAENPDKIINKRKKQIQDYFELAS